MFGIRVKTGHKNTAEDLRIGKTTACMLIHVCFHWPHASIPVEAGVRKRFCQAVRQQAVFAGIKRDIASIRKGLHFWTDLPVAGNYTYPEHTPSWGIPSRAPRCVSSSEARARPRGPRALRPRPQRPSRTGTRPSFPPPFSSPMVCGHPTFSSACRVSALSWGTWHQ
jgi:hypothetical protein